MKNIILIWLWPYAKESHYKLIEKYKVNVLALVDLESKKNIILKYINSKKNIPQQIFFLKDKKKDNDNIDKNIKEKLEGILHKNKVDWIIISTEPKSHMCYLKWAIKNNLNIFVDKPIITGVNLKTNMEASINMYKNYTKLLSLNKKHNKSIVSVNTQRRTHKWFVFIKKLLDNFIKQYQIPISHIQVSHCDGMRNMPDELIYRENHPYKYWYWKIMHSGYHFIDTLQWLLKSNEYSNKISKYCNIYSTSFDPIDSLYQINIENYKKLITTVSLNLLQNWFSRRSRHKLPFDTYKWNWRLRHENRNIQVWPLLNIQIHSYASNEKVYLDTDNNNYDTWSNNHFDVYIFRNSWIIWWKSFEKISFWKKNEDLMNNARSNLFLEFLSWKAKSSLIQDHKLTYGIISTIYNNLAKKYNWKIPYSTMKLD